MSAPLPAEGLGELAWRVEASRSGSPTLLLGGRSVHSRYDPRAEARALAEGLERARAKQGARLVLLIGSGLGYLPQALRARSRAPILVWEPFADVAEAVAGHALPLPPGVTRVTAPGDFLDAAAELAKPLAPPLLQVHPGYEELARFEARFAAHALRKLFRADRPLWVEEATVSRRALECLARFPGLPTVECLEDALHGQTAIVVAPGPSLSAALPLLRERRGGVVLAAVQALRALHEGGVHADFALAPDPRDYRPHLAGFEPRFGALLADTAVDPSLLDRWPERSVLLHLRSPQLQQVVWEACGLPVLDEPFVTVSEIAVVLARRLGARRIVLVGVDLASDSPAYPVRFQARSAEGRPASTNSTYFHAARYLGALCPRLRDEGIAVWRWGSGLPIPGAMPADARGLRRLLREAAPFSWTPPRPAIDPERWKRAQDAIRAVRSASPERRWATGRVAGLHPDTDALAPLSGPELERACEWALERLEQMTPRG